MTFTVLAAVAEFERNLISQRALEAARAGRKSGRLSKRTLAKLRTARQLCDSKEHTVQEMGFGRSTLYRAFEQTAAKASARSADGAR